VVALLILVPSCQPQRNEANLDAARVEVVDRHLDERRPKDGAKMINAVSNSTVPMFTVMIGSSYCAGRAWGHSSHKGPKLTESALD
jgi:hypothetical protein